MEQAQADAKQSSPAEEGESLTSKLPMREGWREPFFLYQGTWLSARGVQSVTLIHAQFQPRSDDIILATYPKCGTTWLKALAFTVANRSHHPVAGDCHPLITHNPHDLVQFLELPSRHLHPVTKLEELPSPRLLATHLPHSQLPPGTSALGCKIVYLCRDPKDVIVSLWHHLKKARPESYSDFGKAFELFCEGVSLFGPIWEHYLGYWKQHMEEPERVLFLKYDEMMVEPAKHVKMLAEFLGVPFTDEEESSGVMEEVVRLCSFKNLRSLPANTSGVTDGAGGKPTDLFFRSGKVGDWENHLTKEMAQKLDCIIEDKLAGSGLAF